MSGKKCIICGKIELLPFKCSYCKNIYCGEHRLPENHNCIMLEWDIEERRIHNSNKQKEVNKKKLINFLPEKNKYITPGDTISIKNCDFQEKESIGNAKKSYSSSSGNEFFGFLLIIIGILLVIGNLSGLFPTFPFAGFITMSIGFYLVHG